MNELLKEYEISVWGDILDGEVYKERKIAVIGSNDLQAKNKVYNPVLTENVNGETTLTFSLQYKYFDENIGDFVVNPIHSLLINERKVKLHFNNKWYDFIIKECEESSEENEFSYVAKDIFVNELSKQGYEIELNRDLNNNLGTVTELAERTLENTDWIVDKRNSDLLQQKLNEPLYTAFTATSFNVVNLNTNEEVTVGEQTETIYLFYSNVANKDGKFLQFIREADRSIWSYDDENVIIAPNYRFEGELTFSEIDGAPVIKNGDTVYITGINAYTENQGYRLVYQSQSLYDPVTEQYVELYRANYTNETQDIYKSTTTDYVTSTLVQSFLTNGTNFQLADDTLVTGWDNLTLTPLKNSKRDLSEVAVSSYPAISKSTGLQALDKINQLSSYLRIKFNGELSITYEDGNIDKGLYRNTIFNSGIMDNGNTIESIAQGEKYVFRVRAGKGKVDTKPTPIDFSVATTNSDLILRPYIAFYRTVRRTVDGVSQYVKTFTKDDIIFNFNTVFHVSPNEITGGYFEEDLKTYVIDNVPQTPSSKYKYVGPVGRKGTTPQTKIWDADKELFVNQTSTNFLEYYYNTAEAKKTVSNKELTDPKVRIGFFLCSNNLESFASDDYMYIEDIEVFRYLEDAGTGNQKKMILPGNVPTAAAVEKTVYYLKPTSGVTSDAINFYSNLEDLAKDLFIPVENIKQVYNDNCEKILSIEESQSNCFNILQTLCETFECWLKIDVEHEINGAIKLDENGRPIKKVSFKEYVGDNNFAGFKYGINLNSIQRSVDSNEIVTRLIVADSANEYAEDGFLSIALAKANPSGESVIYNLNYYVQTGLIANEQDYLTDINNLYTQLKPLNNDIQQLSKDLATAEVALTELEGQAGTYVEITETAQEEYNNALEKFKEIKGQSYSDYLSQHPNDLEESLIDTVGKIYESAVLLNTIGGVTSATNQEYKKLKLNVEGAQSYSVVVSAIEADEIVDFEQDIIGTTETTTEEETVRQLKTKLVVEDYIEGFKFKLQGENAPEWEFETSMNKKEFEVATTSSNPYTTLVILSVPNNYEFQYVSLEDGETYRVTTGSFKIYDEDSHKPLVRKFMLVPTEIYANLYKGYQTQIDKKIEEKTEIIKNFERKYRPYIQEGTWESEDYIDSNLYYFDAVQVGRTSAFPQVSYTINVTEVSELEDLENYNFKIGDKTYIEDTEFFGWTHELIDDPENDEEKIEILTPVKEEVILSEIQWNLDNPAENVITIQNYKTQFEDLFQRISATVQSVQYNESRYNRVANILNPDGSINSDVLARSVAGLIANSYPLAASSTIAITGEGIVATDPNEPKNYVKLTGNGLHTSIDGGQTWNNVLNANGITTDSLTAGTINTQNISIMDGDNTSFRWDKSGLSAYGYNEEEGYDLTSFVRMDKYGIYGVQNGDQNIYESLDDVINAAHFSLTWNGFRIKSDHGNGYVSISSDNDFEVVRVLKATGREPGTSTIEVPKIKIGALEYSDEGVPTKYGININNDSGEPVFTTDDNGDITITGRLNATAGNFSGMVYVGDLDDKYIAIGASEGTESMIASSDYLNNSATGWSINGSGDAIFNNVSVRGAIKTAVFEYSEIEAVGGAFLFRPSSSIKKAEITFDYNITEDTSYNFSKSYYEFTNGEYVLVSPVLYVLSQDVSYDNDKTYYTFVESSEDLENSETSESAGDVGTYVAIEPISYVLPTETVENPHASGWYENEVEYNLVVITPEIEPIIPVNMRWYEIINSEYVLTEDIIVIEGKNYYEQIAASDLDGNLIYVVTEDTSIVEDKVYYVRIDNNLLSPVANGWYEEAIINPHTNNWYESIPKDLLITVEKFLQFREQEWVKLSNNTETITIDNESIESGLVHVYQIDKIDNGVIYFFNKAEIFADQATQAVDEENNPYYKIANLEGGALISFGYAGETFLPYHVLENKNPRNLGLYEIDTVQIDFVSDLDFSKLAGQMAGGNIAFISNEENFDEITYSNNGMIQYSRWLGEEEDPYAIVVYEPLNGWVNENYRRIFIPIAKTWNISLSNYDFIYDNATVQMTYKLTDDEVPVSYEAYYKEAYEGGRYNYGIGINSADDYINLPGRAISLFEADIHPQELTKVTYDYKGILGTLPPISEGLPNNNIYRGMEGTQGIFTNNMYIGDAEQYIAFYSDEEGDHHLDIVGSSINMALNDGEKLIEIINATTDEGIKIHADKLDITNTMTVGDVNGYHIAINSNNNEIGFWSGAEDNKANKTAFILNNKLWIPYSVVLNEMQVGEGTDENGLWSWRVTSDKRLRLVWLGKNEDVKPDKGGDDDDNASSS